jgi:4-hydroxy-2-oxoglutarate aldolase
MATPFVPDGSSIDFDAVRHNVNRWMRTSLRGLVVLGSNGESAFVTPEEADALVDAVRASVPRDRALIVGTGQESTRATIEASRRAARLGADAVLVKVPGFFKGQMTSAALVAHYRAVADASPLPVLLYNFAAAFGVNLPIDAIAMLAEHPNVVGMKESSGDVMQVAEEVSQTPSRFEVVVGSAPSLYPSMCVGAIGGVVAVANCAPDACIRLYDATRGGRHDLALDLQRALTPLARAVTGRFGVAGLKAAMTLEGYRGGAPRMPLAPAPAPVVEELARLMAALNAFLGAPDAVTA